MAGDGGGALTQDVGAGRPGDAIAGWLVGRHRQRFRPPTTDQVSRLHARQLVMIELGLHQAIQLAQTVLLPAGPVGADEHREDVEGTSTLRRVEMGGQLQDGLLAECTRPGGRSPQQLPVPDQEQHLGLVLVVHAEAAQDGSRRRLWPGTL